MSFQTAHAQVGLGESSMQPDAMEARVHETVAPYLLGQPAFAVDRCLSWWFHCLALHAVPCGVTAVHCRALPFLVFLCLTACHWQQYSAS